MHTHYDGQATWDPLLTPSCWHGVTTAVMGNCGVGFAPMKSERRQFLIELMEGVEDIPGAVLAEGVDWGWESFPEYLDVLEGKPAHHGPGRAVAPCCAALLRDGRARCCARACGRRRPAAHGRAHRASAHRRRARLHHLAHAAAQDRARGVRSQLRRSRPRAQRDRRGCEARGTWRAAVAVRLRRPRGGVRAAVRLGEGERWQAAVIHAGTASRDAAAMAAPSGAGRQRAAPRLADSRPGRAARDRPGAGVAGDAAPVHDQAELCCHRCAATCRACRAHARTGVARTHSRRTVRRASRPHPRFHPQRAGAARPRVCARRSAGVRAAGRRERRGTRRAHGLRSRWS